MVKRNVRTTLFGSVVREAEGLHLHKSKGYASMNSLRTVYEQTDPCEPVGSQEEHV